MAGTFAFVITFALEEARNRVSREADSHPAGRRIGCASYPAAPGT
jgi:hypothetical protein